MANQPKSTFKLVRNIVNIKKMFKVRKKRKKDCYDPDQVSFRKRFIRHRHPYTFSAFIPVDALGGAFLV